MFPLAYKVELMFGKIKSYDSDRRLYVVFTDDGRILHNCRKVGDITSNTGARKVAELQPDVSVLLALQWSGEFGTNAPEGYILGGVETYGSGGLGTEVNKEAQLSGAQGFIDRYNRKILLHPDGVIEMRSGAWCQFVMDPDDNSITGFFQNIKINKDRTNYFRWIIHPESDDLKDAVMQACISGKDSLSKIIPDVEILAGALYKLKTEDFFHTDEFKIDPGAKVAIRISNPDGSQRTDFFQQIGSMKDGAVVDTKIVHAGGIEIGIKAGNMTDGGIFSIKAEREGGVTALFKMGDMEEDLTGLIRINNVDIRTYKDGRYQVINDNTEVEGTNEGELNLVCLKSNLGTKEAGKHVALAEDVIELIDSFIKAVLGSTYMVASPGAPTAPPGPINMPAFKAVQAQLNKIKSTVHTIDK